MRKLVLFGLLGAIFGFALALEHVFSKQEKPREVAANQAVFTIGGGPPRAIPETPPPDDSRGDDRRDRDREARHDGRLEKTDPVGPARPFVEPRPAPTPTPEPTPTARFHVVVKGETLSQIAHDELGSAQKWKELASWNGLPDASKLVLGSRLRLTPPATDGRDGRLVDTKPTPVAPNNEGHGSTPDAKRTHKVEKGETLSKIAALYLGDAQRWREIQRLNKIGDDAHVAEGATLELPER
jgi:nucleoid-associated protein YgaU